MNLVTNNQKLIDECIKAEMAENDGFDNIYKFFEFFASSMILKNRDLSDDEILGGIVGNGNDGGIDGFYLFVNDELITEDLIDTFAFTRGGSINLVIVQAKYTSSFSEDALMKWKVSSGNLLNLGSLDDYRARYTTEIIENFKLFGDVIKKAIRLQYKLYIDYFYVTLGVVNEIHQNVIAQKDELEQQIRSIYPSAVVSIYFRGADELMDSYNKSPNMVSTLAFVEQPISVGASDLVALVNLKTYFRFITDDGNNLHKRYFEANVRDYQGSNSVNKSIADTLRNATYEDFWWLNNGVTILTSNLTRVTNKEITIENPEIVNGLQTSREVYNYFSSMPERLDKETRNILVRIIKPNDEDVRDKIIFATNNQTNIPKYSLRVTDNIHIQIELYFKNRGLYYDRRKNYYRNQRKKATDIIGVSFLAQCLISIILRKPDFARARPSTLLADEGVYNSLYNKDINLEAYYRAAMIGKKVKQLVNLSELSTSAKNDVLFYVIYVVVVICLHKKDIAFNDLITFDLKLLTDEIVYSSIDLVSEKYNEKGASSNVAKSSEFINDIDNMLMTNHFI